MKKLMLILVITLIIFTQKTLAFCGFYVAKADAKLFNESSQVILVREGNRNIITMSNDFDGDIIDFAMVIPVPTVLQEKDIKVVDISIFDRIDAYSAPRLVEYYDQNPCEIKYPMPKPMTTQSRARASSEMKDDIESESSHGVTIEAKYTVGEYDILILSAKESSGLQTWLIENGYKIPEKARQVLEPYVKSNLKFFVVKVNLDYFNSNGDEAQNLRPIQISFDSPKFMLPIRLGMANSKGDQDMQIYAFSKKGRVECTNYRTVKLPTDKKVPEFIKDSFGKFYKDLFDKYWAKQGQSVMLLEYAWDVSPNQYVKCDPCVGNPPETQTMLDAGIPWLKFSDKYQTYNDGDVFFTRLHVRYNREHFAQDLVFQETPNRENYQARYVITHPASGDFNCTEGQNYLRKLIERRTEELNQMTNLAGWGQTAYLEDGYLSDYKKQLTNKTYKNDWTLPFGFNNDSNNNFPSGNLLSVLFCAVLIFALGLWLFMKKQVKKLEPTI